MVVNWNVGQNLPFPKLVLERLQPRKSLQIFSTLRLPLHAPQSSSLLQQIRICMRKNSLLEPSHPRITFEKPISGANCSPWRTTVASSNTTDLTRLWVLNPEPIMSHSSFLIIKPDAACCLAAEKPVSTLILTQFGRGGTHLFKSLGLGCCKIDDIPRNSLLKPLIKVTTSSMLCIFCSWTNLLRENQSAQIVIAISSFLSLAEFSKSQFNQSVKHKTATEFDHR